MKACHIYIYICVYSFKQIPHDTWFLLQVHSQQQPSMTLWNGKWKHLPIQSQSARTWFKQDLKGSGVSAFLALFRSLLFHGEPSCRQTGLEPAKACLMAQASTSLMSSKVPFEQAKSGRITSGIRNLPFLPDKPGRLRLIMMTDSVLS